MACTPKEICSVRYNDLDDAVANCLKLIQYYNDRVRKGDPGFDKDADPQVFLGKTDLSSTFRVLPLLVQCFAWLVFKAINPNTGN